MYLRISKGEIRLMLSIYELLCLKKENNIATAL